MLFGKQIEKIYRAKLFTRCDDPESVFYFTPEDFPSLIAEPYAFSSRKGIAYVNKCDCKYTAYIFPRYKYR